MYTMSMSHGVFIGLSLLTGDFWFLHIISLTLNFSEIIETCTPICSIQFSKCIIFNSAYLTDLDHRYKSTSFCIMSFLF